jgi:hypothetical protein
MALEFRARRATDQGALNVRGTKEDKLSGSHQLSYDVEVVSTETDFDPTTVTEADVFLQSTGTWPNGKLPIVNRSIYKFGNYYVPYFVCRSKTIKRNPKKRNWFTVQCDFSFDGEKGEEPKEEETALTSVAPKVEPSIEETEFVLYKDYTPAPDGPRAVLTPNGNFWSEPLVVKLPVLVLKITQYEASITYDQMLERSLKCNQEEYRTQPRYQWITGPVVATEVEVVTSTTTLVAAQVQYTLRRSPFSWGWKDSRVLVDTHYRPTVGEDPIPFVDNKLLARKTGFIKADGTFKPGNVPDYTDYEGQPTIDFEDFLQA